MQEESFAGVNPQNPSRLTVHVVIPKLKDAMQRPMGKMPRWICISHQTG